MKLRITADNYEEIMFRLVEDDFDEATRKDLLAQIETDPLFSFEWESWQKTIFTDPIENYTAGGSTLAESIIERMELRKYKKRLFYYLAAASFAVLMINWFLLNTEFKKSPGIKMAEQASKPQVLPESIIRPAQKFTTRITISGMNQNEVHMSQIETLPVAIDTANIQYEEIFAEIPVLIDSVPVKVLTLAETPAKKSRYSVTVETTSIADNKMQNTEIAQNQKVKYEKVLTNPRLYLLRKPNGEPEKLVLIGEEDNYLCLRLNYVEK